MLAFMLVTACLYVHETAEQQQPPRPHLPSLFTLPPALHRPAGCRAASHSWRGKQQPVMQPSRHVRMSQHR